MNTNVAHIEIKNSIEEAPNYKKLGGFEGASITKFVIVRDGTADGRSTVDIIFEDDKGNKFVTMLTGRLLRSVAAAIGDEG